MSGTAKRDPVSDVVVERKVAYYVLYTYPSCIDDGETDGLHDVIWREGSEEVQARDDKEAQLASLTDRFNWREDCRGRYAHPRGIIKVVRERTASGFERRIETDVPLPEKLACPCGKVYMPIRGEGACHQLVSTA